MTAFDIIPEDLNFRFDPSSHLVEGSSCSGRGTRSVPTIPEETTKTLIGCTAGAATVELRSVSGNRLLDSVSITVGSTHTPTPTPTSANVAPTINGPTSERYREDRTDNVGHYTITDPEGGVVTVELSGDDKDLFDLDSSGYLKFGQQPDFENPADFGGDNAYNVAIEATDDGSPNLTTLLAVTVTVEDANERPVVAVQIAGQTLTVGGGSTSISLSDKFSDADLGDTLSYEAESSDTGVVTVGVSGSSLTLTPVAAGSTSVEVTATDPDNLSALQSFTVTVTPPPPSCSNSDAVSNAGSNPGLVGDCEILMAAKDTLRGTASLNWSYDTAITGWDGVTVSGAPIRATKLYLRSKGLNGTIPSGLGGLSALTSLELQRNMLTGSIPRELGSLSNLEFLVLGINSLTGGIPSELGDLYSLKELWLKENQLSGAIPAELGNLTDLEIMTLRDNQLSGAIPPELGKLTDLERLNVSSNNLSGRFPSELGDLTSLTRVHFDANGVFTGCVPLEWEDIRNSTPASDVSLSYCPGPATLEVGDAAPFVGQSVTITASASALDGTSPSYQWQEWSSSGQWTDVGAASTSATKSVSSSSAGVRTFRVRAMYGSAVTTESAPIAIEWRPITVAITVSDPNPESGEKSESSVTLTAVADAPSDVTYQWQRWLNGGWVDRESSTSATKVVWFNSRGTRKYRVVVSHATAASAASLPAYVTWDEWAIVSDLVTALQSAVSGDADYMTAQTALVSCMNGGSGGSSRSSRGSGGRERGTGNATSTATSTPPVGRAVTPSPSPTPAPTPTYASFDDILSKYTGDTKAKMDAGGACHTDAEAMFDAVESLSGSKLAALKTGSTEYAALLETPHGQQFEANVGADYIIKQFAYLMASDTTEEPGELEAPLYQTASGATRTSRSPTPPTIPALGTGFSCLPTGVDGKRLSVRNKLVVLNCLVFSTPHSFWVDNTDRLEADPRYSWLGYGPDWSCTWFPDVSDSICRKHDIALASLKKFAGSSQGNEDDNEMDEAWNPRNKHLADIKFDADIQKYDCQTPSNIGQVPCVLPATLDGPDFLDVLTLASLMHFGVSEINSPWPVTSHDVKHTDTFHRFVRCDTPHITPNPLTKSGNTISATWTYSPGCVEDITVDRYILCWQVSRLGPITTTHCRREWGGNTGASFEVPFRIWGWDSVKLKTVAIRPNDIEYGTEEILETLDGILPYIPVPPLPQALAIIFDKIATEHYPEQDVSLTIQALD